MPSPITTIAGTDNGAQVRDAINSNFAARNAVSWAAVSTTPYAALSTDEVLLVDASSAAVTVDLPAISTLATGKTYTVKKIDSSANTVTIDGDGSETIDGALTVVIASQYDSVTVFHDDTEWWIK